MTKTCRSCGIDKHLTEFGKHSGRPDGLHYYCRACVRAKTKAWALRNPDKTSWTPKRREVNKAWAARNKHKLRSQKHKRYLAHKNEVLARNQKWVQENHAQSLEIKRRWKKTHPEQARIDDHRRRARLSQASGSFTSTEWQALKAKHGHRCLGCGRAEPEVKLSPDHVVPLSRGGSNDIGNIQPLCIEINGNKRGNCQNRKGTKSTDYRQI